MATPTDTKPLVRLALRIIAWREANADGVNTDAWLRPDQSFDDLFAEEAQDALEVAGLYFCDCDDEAAYYGPNGDDGWTHVVRYDDGSVRKEPSTEDHLNYLRAYFEAFKAARAIPYGRDPGERVHEAVERGKEYLAWAEGIDTTVAPSSKEDAVVRAAACIFKRAAQDHGPRWAYEVLVFPPEQTEWEGSGDWRICWEAGPDSWGVFGTSVVPDRYRENDDQGWFTEPYFSFDICYTEG